MLEAHELEEGRDYFIVLTTSGGLYRYDIHDVVRCVGFEGEAPLLEFLNKGKNFSNLTGEKLSEHQAIRAVEQSFQELRLPIDTFTLAPVMEEQPRYVLLVEPQVHQGRAAELARRVQANLERINEEYAAKCASGRLLPVEVREVPAGTWDALRQRKEPAIAATSRSISTLAWSTILDVRRAAGRAATRCRAASVPVISWHGRCGLGWVDDASATAPLLTRRVR